MQNDGDVASQDLGRVSVPRGAEIDYRSAGDAHDVNRGRAELSRLPASH